MGASSIKTKPNQEPKPIKKKKKSKLVTERCQLKIICGFGKL